MGGRKPVKCVAGEGEGEDEVFLGITGDLEGGGAKGFRDDFGGDGPVHDNMKAGCQNAAVFGGGKFAFWVESEFLIFGVGIVPGCRGLNRPGLQAVTIVEGVFADGLRVRQKRSEDEEENSKVRHGATECP